MYKVGDKIVYPLHGAGIVEGIEDKEMSGDVKKYYTVKLSHNQLKIMVPEENCNEIGIRVVISKKKAKEILELLGGNRSRMPRDWNLRYKKNKEKLKTGDIFEVAEVVKNLSWRDGDVGLSTGEKRLLNQAKQILVSELCYSLDMTIEETEIKIDKILRN